MKNKQIIKWSVIVLIALTVIGFIYTTFFKTNYYGSINNNNILLVFIAGALIIGAVIMYLIQKAFFSEGKKIEVKESSHTVVESMRKVFKVVTAEGHFNEIYNYEESTKLFGFIPTQKKALVIVHAKAMIGYDFEKAEWEFNEQTQKVILKKFPVPEILSIDTDYQYYNIEENLLNKFSREDLARIQENGKKQVILAARNSNLPAVAAEQMRTLLTEIVMSKKWRLENAHLITDATKLLKSEESTHITKEKKKN